ncbi:ABC transporter ATP-binding protein [Bacteroidota bacterium]
MLKLDKISLQVGEFRLQEISFDVKKGDYLVILGLSGVGKSLLLEVIAGLQELSSGEIYLRGKKITNDTIQSRKISIVYQDVVLFPHLTVYENIAYPMKSNGENKINEKVLRYAEQVGLADKLNRKPETLSGGEAQRAALARSLAAGSDIFLLDEPLASLDLKSRVELRALLRKLNRSGITFIHITHEYEEALSLASKIGVMENGKLIDLDSPENIFKHPKSDFIAHFVGIRNCIKGNLQTNPDSDLKEFSTDRLKIYCLTDSDDGEAYLMIQSNEITISNTADQSSSRNHFKGVITDIAPAKLGYEVAVDIGHEVIVTISGDALKSLELKVGNEVFVNFKASSCKIYN